MPSIESSSKLLFLPQYANSSMHFHFPFFVQLCLRNDMFSLIEKLFVVYRYRTLMNNEVCQWNSKICCLEKIIPIRTVRTRLGLLCKNYVPPFVNPYVCTYIICRAPLSSLLWPSLSCFKVFIFFDSFSDFQPCRAQ